MRLFWKVFAVLWLATLLVGGSGFLVSRTLQQDWLLLQLNPELRDFAEQLVNTYEQDGPRQAQRWLEQQRRTDDLRAHLFDEAGNLLLPGTLPAIPRFAPGPGPEQARRGDGPGRGRLFQLAWDTDKASYFVTLHVPPPALWKTQRAPVALILNVSLAMALLALLSLVLSRYLTRPLRQLGSAAQALARGASAPAACSKPVSGATRSASWHNALKAWPSRSNHCSTASSSCCAMFPTNCALRWPAYGSAWRWAASAT